MADWMRYEDVGEGTPPDASEGIWVTFDLVLGIASVSFDWDPLDCDFALAFAFLGFVR